MGAHEELLRRHRQVMPGWLALFYDEPIELVDGKGCRVVDGEGNEYLDLFAGILTTMVGYGAPEVVEAVQRQAARMLHTSTLYLIRPMVELAERIAALSGIPDAKVFFTTSGSEANEAALLLAATARRSSQVLALRNSYHGRSFATMGVTGNRGWSASSLTPFQVSYVQNGYRFRSPFRHLPDEAFTAAVVDDLRDVIATTTAGDVAALIAEPIQGVGGFTVPPDGMFGAMQEVCAEHGILWITDEVQTGWGRTGEHLWGYQAHGLRPDLLTFAKGVGNGLPLAGVVASAELMDGIDANSISTFGGNPLSCAAGLAVLDLLAAHDLQANAARSGRVLMEHLSPLVERHGLVGDVRGKGLMVGIELVGPDGFASDAAAAGLVLEECRRNGVLIGKGGLFGSCLRIAPPLTLSEAEAHEGAEVVARAIATVDERLGAARAATTEEDRP